MDLLSARVLVRELSAAPFLVCGLTPVTGKVWKASGDTPVWVRPAGEAWFPTRARRGLAVRGRRGERRTWPELQLALLWVVCLPSR